MLLTSRNKALTLLAGLALALGAALALAHGAAPARAPQQPGWTAAGFASPGLSRPAIFEGPGGRAALTRWTLRTDPSDRGLSLGWQRGGFAGAAVGVPDVIDARSFTGAAGVRNYEGSLAWYRATFQAPHAGTYALLFQSANFQADVWVDGHRLGSHRGSYLPFELRAALAAGAHQVVVRIDWRDPARQSQSGFHRTWFNWGGLDGEVNVRPIGESELSGPTIQTTLTPDSRDAAQALVRVTVEVHNHGPSRTLTPEGTLVHGEQAIPIAFPAIALEHEQSATASATVSVPQPALWSPTSPNLYQLTLAVGGESSYSARIGLRQLTWHGGRIYLNGGRLRLHGATIQQDALGHGDALSTADEQRIVSELRAIGANCARAQHPLDPGLLERLDAAGILVWQGIGPVEGAGNWYSTTSALLAGAEQQARTAALAAELHPSIFAWNLVDEVANNGRNGAEVHYVRTITRWLHAHDPTRLVAADVWGDHPPAQAGSLYSEVDAVAETDYSGWYDNPQDSPSQLRAQMRARLAAMRATFAGKVLLISEFGAESNNLNAPGSPGSYGYQSRLLAAHIAVYEADPRLSGMLIWVLRDYPLNPNFQGGSIHGVLPSLRLIEGLNQKGLFTYGGQPKPAVAMLSHVFGALPRD
jgi:Glycosyl hydrolases family 2/Glycosyl hydrolases family 2, TIM barrel domain/Glycosyl hydrolases family 2, sugar binding domain